LAFTDCSARRRKDLVREADGDLCSHTRIIPEVVPLAARIVRAACANATTLRIDVHMVQGLYQDSAGFPGALMSPLATVNRPWPSSSARSCRPRPVRLHAQ
jgi:hypothetical protein